MMLVVLWAQSVNTYAATSLHFPKKIKKLIDFNQFERTLKYFAEDAMPIFNFEQFQWGATPRV